MNKYTLILSRKYKDSYCILNGDDYEGLVWLADTPKPTKKQLDDFYLKNNFIEKAYEWAINQTFDELANDWTNKLLK